MNIHKYFPLYAVFFVCFLCNIHAASASDTLFLQYEQQKKEIFTLPVSPDLPLEFPAEIVTQFLDSVWDYCFSDKKPSSCNDITRVVFQGMYNR